MEFNVIPSAARNFSLLNSPLFTMKNNKLFARLSAGIAITALSLPAHADIRDQLDVQTGKAELVIPDVAPQKVAVQVKDAISSWSIPASSNVRSLPSLLPARPGEPASVQNYIRGNPVVEYQCGTAYAEIVKRPPPINNPFMYAAEFTQACVYPFQKGVKVYLIFTSAKKTEALTSGLFNGITRAIRGQDADWMTKQLNENIGAIKKNLPSLLIEKIEVPGEAVQEPDRDAVAALIPAAAPVAAVTQLLPVAPSPVNVQGTAVAVAAPASAMSAKIEARKNLNSMGMTYHSQEQFIAAIRRKDDVAVQLFLDAGGIDLTVREKNGKSAVDIATEIGAADIAAMISERIKNPSAAPVISAPAVQPGSNTPPAVSGSDKAHSVNLAAASLPSEALAAINAEIDSMNLPPAQKEEMRAQAILNSAAAFDQLRSLTSRISPQ